MINKIPNFINLIITNIIITYLFIYIGDKFIMGFRFKFTIFPESKGINNLIIPLQL